MTIISQDDDEKQGDMEIIPFIIQEVLCSSRNKTSQLIITHVIRSMLKKLLY